MNDEMDIHELIAEIDITLNAGDDTAAEKKILDSIAKYSETCPDNLVGQSVLFNELGGFYRSRGFFDQGETAFLKAKDLLEQAGESPYTVNYATTLNNLAGLYRMSRQFQKAIASFDAAIDAYEHCTGDVPADYLASVYNNKGLLYLDLQDYPEAKSIFRKAEGILEKGGSYPFALGTTLSNLGFAFIAEKEYPEAAKHFKRAKSLFAEAGDDEMAQNCENMLLQLGVGQ